MTSASFYESESMNLISKASFWKRDREKVFLSNVLIRGYMNPLHRHKVMSFDIK